MPKKLCEEGGLSGRKIFGILINLGAISQFIQYNFDLVIFLKNAKFATWNI
jgi:hypothetical protein